MCIKGGSKTASAAPPAPTPVANPNNVADTSNTAQRQAVVASQTAAAMPSFGSELGDPRGKITQEGI